MLLSLLLSLWTATLAQLEVLRPLDNLTRLSDREKAEKEDNKVLCAQYDAKKVQIYRYPDGNVYYRLTGKEGVSLLNNDKTPVIFKACELKPTEDLTEEESKWYSEFKTSEQTRDDSWGLGEAQQRTLGGAGEQRLFHGLNRHYYTPNEAGARAAWRRLLRDDRYRPGGRRGGHRNRTGCVGERRHHVNHGRGSPGGRRQQEGGARHGPIQPQRRPHRRLLHQNHPPRAPADSVRDQAR